MISLNIAIAVLVGMILCHLLADYPLQGWLAQAKAKTYWANSPENNQFDWTAALAGHATMWGIVMMIPIAWACNFELGWFWFALPANIIFHYFIDWLKANKQKINLVVDQYMHIWQIITTWWIWLMVFDSMSIPLLIVEVCSFGVLIILRIIVDAMMDFKRLDKQLEEDLKRIREKE